MSQLCAFTNTHIALCVVAGVLVIAIIVIFCLVPMKSWFTALFSGAPISMHRLMSFRLRKIKYGEIVYSYIQARKANLKVRCSEIETLFLAGGDCRRAVNALITAKSAKLPIDFNFVKSCELAKQNSLEAVESAITPKTILVENISAISQDNIEIIASARATIRVNFANFIGGYGEEALKSRIHKQVLTNIALSPNHKLVLASPNKLLTGVVGSSIDEGGAYRIISAEIVKVDVGRDVGAELASKNAQKDIAMAQIEAERIKNNGIMREHQLRAKAEEMKSEVLSAEAEVPKAIAEAIKEGRFSVMDYYKLMNLQADTAMRRSIVKDKKDGE